MNAPNRPLPPPVREMWNTVVTATKDKDPLHTLTSLELRAIDTTKAWVPPPGPPPVSVADLPSVPVVTSNAKVNECVASDFEVLGLLGEGGMGRVLLARQKSLQRDVALKVLKGDEPRREVMNSLLTEAVITGSIEHPSIVPVHALGRDENGLPVLVMKRIDGVSWRRLFENPNHPLWASLGVDANDRLEAHLEILMAVCNALHYAHSRGIVHRDIKLDNIMMGGFGEVYLVDWGIAMRFLDPRPHDGKYAELEPPVGTLAYMAPEMAMGEVAQIDARTDVYLLGATLHFILTGNPRHVGESTLDILLSARDSLPFVYGPDVPPDLAAICNRAMHVDREKRFSSALELRQALALFRRHRGSLALSAKAFAALTEMEKAEILDERCLQRMMTECRFAFMQALEAWPGNQRAREGLDKIIVCMIDFEISRRHVEGARVLLTELSTERPDLAKKVEDLALDVEREKKEALRLQTMARDADLRIDARFLVFIIATMPLAALLAFIVFVFSAGDEQLLLRRLIVYPITVIMLLVTAFLFVRKRLSAAISRRTFAFLLLFPTSLLVHRIFAILQGDTIPSILMTDMIISAFISIALAVGIAPRLAWVALSFIAGAILTLMLPEHAATIFLFMATLGTILIVAIWSGLVSSANVAVKN